MHQQFSVRRRLLAAAFVAAALVPLAFVLPISATVEELRTGGDLVAAAEAIVVGRCSAVASEWHDRALVTHYTIQVDETLKGDVPSEIDLWIPGGIDQDRPIPIAVTVPGAPTLFAGEEVLLFLSLVSEVEGYALLGLAQGKMTVHREEPGGESWLRVGPEGSGGRRSLKAVKDEIRSFLESEVSQ